MIRHVAAMVGLLVGAMAAWAQPAPGEPRLAALGEPRLAALGEPRLAALGEPRLAALGEPRLTTLGATARTLDYEHDVAAMLNQRGCSRGRCHGAVQGKGGLRLSMFGAYPLLDYEMITKVAGGRRINRNEPARSLLLLKATGTIPHEGGSPIPPTSGDADLLRGWIADGALWSLEGKPALTGLTVTPPESTLAKGETKALSVLANYSDGSKQDVTSSCSFHAADPDVAAIGAGGRIEAKGFGQGTIVAVYLHATGAAHVLVPQPLAQAFPEVPVNNTVDTLVNRRLKLLGFPPSEVCSDAVFLRRLYLTVTGRLALPEQARSFLADTAPDKRARLIDQLLASDAFADYAAMKWSDLLRIKSEYPVNVWPKGVQAYYQWLRESLRSGKPYDQFVTELLTATGSDFRDGASNFYRAVTTKDAQTFGETAALLFMGARLACARCHAHPYETWTYDDNAAMGAFFAQVRFKGTQEWKEEIVYLDPDAQMNHPRNGKPVPPKFLGGETPKIEPGQDPRAVFAQWLTTKGNPWFARNAANRVWAWLFGRGIVEEPDDLRPSNPPANPELLDYLAGELADHQFDLRHLYRLVLNSRTWQLVSTPTEQNRADTRMFSHFAARRMEAEQLFDALNQVTESTTSFSSNIPEPYTFLPPDMRAVQVADGSIDTAFLLLFGRPSRDTPFESGRCSRTSIRQTMSLLSSAEIEGKIADGRRLARLAATGIDPAAAADEIYLAALSRGPDAREKQALTAYLGEASRSRAQALGDVMWAVLNQKEFLFIR